MSKFVFGQMVIYNSPIKEDFKKRCVYIRESADGRALVMFQSATRISCVDMEQLECDSGTAMWIDEGIIDDFPKKGCNLFHLLVCSECGTAHKARIRSDFSLPMNGKYCPHCGIKMNGIFKRKV